MCYQIFVTIFHNRKYLSHYFHNVFESNPFIALVEFLQYAIPLYFLEDDIEERRLKKVFDYLDSIRMVKFFKVLNLGDDV